MKIVIDIPETVYEAFKEWHKNKVATVEQSLIANGIPYEERPIEDLSSYSDKLWKKAYERGKAEGIKTGHWNYASFGNQTLVKCSECEEEFLGKDVSDYKFCPICGCRMIEETENE